MEAIDRKFFIEALHTTKGTRYTHDNAVLFLAKDKALPATLRFYREEAERLGAAPAQLVGITLLTARVERFQRENSEAVKVPDVDPGPEETVVNRPNEGDAGE